MLCDDLSCNVVNCCACRVLLRVRLLYYLKQEVIGQQADIIFSGAPARYAVYYQTLFIVGEVFVITVSDNCYYLAVCSPCMSIHRHVQCW